tara:strand:+ start:515 stop:1405 length:891 start_codon:yes stop_codon:yes gene_type:complete
MKKFLGIIVLSLLLSTNAFSKSGKGNVTLSKKAMETFLDYLYGGAKNLNPSTGGSTNNKGQKTQPLLFTLSETGDAYQYYYCSFLTCTEPNKYKAILGCQKYSNGTSCFTFAVKKKIVWKNNQNPKGLRLSKELKHGRNHVAQLIKDAGYYNGDITLLSGFKAENLTISKSKSISNTNTKKIEKKKETKKVVNKYELKGERSIALSWDGYENLIAGTVEFDEADYKGTLNLPLPNNDGTCDGTYSLQEDGKGTWQISCTNNMGAAGTLKWTKNGGVTGSGRDHNDKKVKFTVSKKS